MRADGGPLVPRPSLPTVSLIVQLLWLTFDTVKKKDGASLVVHWLRLGSVNDRDSVKGQRR